MPAVPTHHASHGPPSRQAGGMSDCEIIPGVIPAKAGIHLAVRARGELGPRFRGDDTWWVGRDPGRQPASPSPLAGEGARRADEGWAPNSVPEAHPSSVSAFGRSTFSRKGRRRDCHLRASPTFGVIPVQTISIHFAVQTRGQLAPAFAGTTRGGWRGGRNE